MNIAVHSIGSQREVNLNFNDMQLNTTIGQDSASSMMEFSYNRAGNFNISITETTADNSNGECLNGINDCVVNYSFFDGMTNGYAIHNKDNISVPYNTHLKAIYANISCVAYSCPQSKSVNIKLQEY